MSDDACYRAMDWLIAVEDQLARGVFDAVAHLLNLEVDLIFFDTTSTYFETEQPDEPVWRDAARPPSSSTDSRHRRRHRRRRRTATVQPPAGATAQAGFRTHGKSKDSRDDLPAGRGRDGRDPRRDPGAGVVLAGQHLRLAADPPGQGRAAGLDAGEGHLGRRPRVHLRGQPPPPGRRRRTATSWARSCAPAPPEAAAALARQGRYQDVTANLRVKEVKVSEHERFVVCHNPDAADRDAAVRANLVERLEAMIDGSDRLSPTQAGRAARGDLHQARA